MSSRTPNQIIDGLGNADVSSDNQTVEKPIVIRSLRAVLMVGIIFAAVIGLFWPTFQSLLGLDADATSRSPSGFVLIVFVIMLWSLRDELAAIAITPQWSGIVGLVALGFIWFIGEILFVRIITYFAVIAMLPAAVFTILGRYIFRALVFPLAFLLLAVPIDGLIAPTLVNWTADFTFFALHASGIPLYREGASFLLPTGAWSIADACSGSQYLSVCAILGVLYAWAMYRSVWRRTVFIAGVLVLGIVGNWIRAYFTIFIAHATNNQLLRDDHSTFGWCLFAVLFAIYCWLGWQCRGTARGQFGEYEDTEWLKNNSDPTARALVTLNLKASDSAVSQRRTVLISAAFFTTCIVLFAGPLIHSKLAPVADLSANSATKTDTQAIHIKPRSGWLEAENSGLPWLPSLTNPSWQQRQSFEKNGRRVDLYIGVFQHQTWQSKLVSTSNQWVNSDDPNWSLAVRGSAPTSFDGKPLTVDTGVIKCGVSGTAPGANIRVLAWRWYLVNGHASASGLEAKIQQLRGHLPLRLAESVSSGEAAAWIALYLPLGEQEPVENAAEFLDGFMREMSPALMAALARIE